MQFPKHFKLTPHGAFWTVHNRSERRTTHNGDCYPAVQQLHVYTATRYGTRTLPQQTQTFWHELLHAALHDMGHPLYDNELFVDALAKRLATASLTATP